MRGSGCRNQVAPGSSWLWASTTSWRAGRVRLLSAVALMAVRPSPPCLGWQARATRRRRRVEGGGGGGGWR